MSFRFRAPAPEDVEGLLALMRDFYAHEDIPFVEQAARAGVERLVAEPSLGGIWLIEDAAETIGYLVLTLGYSLEFQGRDALVDELYIRDVHRGRGAGGAALRFAEEQCRRNGARALHLEVGRENVRAQSLYHRAGFRDHDRYLLTKWV